MAIGPTSPSAQRVQALLDELGLPGRVVEFSASTRTAAEAAAAIGCDVAQIVKSLVFRLRESGRPILVLVSGINRVDERALAGRLADQVAGEKIERADAVFVRATSGFTIGGVPPIGHLVPPITLIDRDLMHFDTIWAAAGTPHAVFPLTPADLARITGGQIDQVT